MSDVMILLTPFLVLLILAVFRFIGCDPFTAAPTPPTTVTGPPLVIAPPDPPAPAKPAAEAYEELIKATPGFAAMWPLNESGGNVANVVGPLNPAANGLYLSPGAPAGTGYSVGQNGVLFHKDTKDFAPEFTGTVAYIEVLFNGQLNPGKTVPLGFSIELWAKPNPAAGGMTQVLISSHRSDSAGVQQGYEIALIKNAAQPNQQIRGRVYANGQMTETLVTPLQGNPDEWRHIVLTYEQSATVPLVSLQVRLAKSANTFKDGPHSAQYEAVLPAKPSTFRFGAGHATGQTAENFFAGRIDNVAFYNAKLVQGQIDDHFKAF